MPSDTEDGSLSTAGTMDSETNPRAHDVDDGETRCKNYHHHNGSNGRENSSSKEFHAASDHHDQPSCCFRPSTTIALQQRRSSLDLRKLPPNELLLAESDNFGGGSSADLSRAKRGFGAIREQHTTSCDGRFLRRTCLNSKFCLRTQLMLSFGLVSALAIVVVMLVCILVSIYSGRTVNVIANDSFVQLSRSKEGLMARFLAEGLTLRLFPEHAVNIIKEATRDRFSGYPHVQDDSEVPFWDIDSQSNVYPIVGDPLPLDWQFTSNIRPNNLQEHIQHREDWYDDPFALSTASAVYFMQGICDPNVTDPTAHTYFPNCTQANNDLTTGGVVAPSPFTNQHVHRKASDLAPLLKAMYEFHPDIKGVGVYFINDGAGSTMAFPARSLNATATYASDGCDWMLQPNPLEPSRPIATLEMHSRCEQGGHIKGATISARLYNPMDRAWCIDQALHPEKVRVTGPVRSPWSGGQWLLLVGRSVYDRITKELIGCISMEFVLTSVEDALDEAKLTPNSEVTVVRWNDAGTVVASTSWNMSAAKFTITVDQIHVGVTLGDFQDFTNLVNFSNVWDPTEVRQKFEALVVRGDEFAVAAYPMPPPPDKYEPTYFPEFLALMSLSQKDFQDAALTVNDSVQNTVAQLILLAVIVGCAGLVFVTAIISMVSHSLTLPLKYMNNISTDIVKTFASKDSNDSGIVIQGRVESKCTPKTELSETLAEFQQMVSKFSGSAIAKSMKVNSTQMKNSFTMFASFEECYKSRLEPAFGYGYGMPEEEVPETNPGTSSQLLSREVPRRLHFGPIVNDRSDKRILRASEFSTRKRRLTSPLFIWIVLLIVTPLLITTISISVYVTHSIWLGLANITDDAKAAFVSLEVSGLHSFVGLRASFAAKIAGKSVLDNYVLARYASWLLFGGLTRANSFTELLTGTDTCKNLSSVDDCERAKDNICDCSWGEYVPRSKFYENVTCSNFTVDSRLLQKSYFVCESDSRDATTFPKSPAATAWYETLTSLPGSQKGSNASSLDSLYGRTRAISSLPLFQTIFNAAIGDNSFISTMIGFDADGMVVGYSGCTPAFFIGPFWASTPENGAAELRPDLCPVGKFGFDPRCREWYATGRERSVAENEGLYITSPYLFAGNSYGQTCTSPLVDPMTGQHVGQTMVDFISTPIFEALKSHNTPLSATGFPFLITGGSSEIEADTVVGPGFSLGEEASVPIEQLVIPFDFNCTQNDCHYRAAFRNITEGMKLGRVGTSHFERTTPEGSIEKVYMAFAAVETMVFNPVDSSNFSSGVNRSDYLIYSLALAEPEEDLLKPFEEANKGISRQIHVAIIVLSIVIVLATSVLIYVSNQITNSIVEPMIYLLELIRHINRLVMDGNPPGFDVLDRDYGSSEVLSVINTMETLYRVVQSANVSFFAGDVEKAFTVLSDAARLFLRLENKKAEGVANNNLGNIMLAFYRTMESTGETQVCGLTRREIIGKGMVYFHRAIQLGEKAYDEFYELEGWSPNCLEFMQHLANRYFNRAMFLLTVKDGHEKPKEIEELGRRDLQITKDMDMEIAEQGTEVGWDVRSVDAVFEIILGRIRGHLVLLEMGYPDDWELAEVLDEAFVMLKKELKNDPDSSALFRDFKPAGRMQQVEAELIRYKLLIGDVETAAKIAIRILVEDEQTLPDAQMRAVEALVAYVDSIAPDNDEQRRTVKAELAIYQRWLTQTEVENDMRLSISDETASTCSVHSSFKPPLHKTQNSSSSMSSDLAKQRLLKSRRESTRGDVTMEVF